LSKERSDARKLKAEWSRRERKWREGEKVHIVGRFGAFENVLAETSSVD